MSAKPQSIDRTLSQAKSLARQGEIMRAEALYRTVLERFPQNKRAQNGLQALANGLLETKRDALKKSAKPVPEADPALSHVRRGRRYLAAARPDRAEPAFAEALRVNPDCAEAYSGLSASLRLMGRNRQAVEHAKRAISLKPKLGMAYENLGTALVALEEHPDALFAFAEAMRLNPTYTETYVSTAEALMALGKYDEALRSFAIAVQIRPDSAHIHNQLGTALNKMGRHAEAMASLKEALRISPEQSAVHNNLGAVLGAMGDRDAAATSFERSIAIRAEHAQAHFNLANYKKFRSDDPHIAQMRGLLDRPGLPAEDAMFLNFSLGKAYEDLGETDPSFAYYLEGNRLRKSASGYGFESDIRLFNRIKTLFPEQDTPRLPDESYEGPRPIFILGMPRSGTSLMEQILASHSAVHGAGELELLARSARNVFFSPSNDKVSAITEDQLREARDQYRDGIAKLGISSPVFVDKMPLNFRFIGWILSAMPEARIIHMDRDPMATCWSVFKHRFSSRGNGYAYDMEDLGHYYRLYRDLMAYWHRLYPGRITEMVYEDLTEHQEEQTRRALDAMGLTWEDACLDFHTTRRSVMTASANQVRKRMYKGSSEVWHKYEAHLGPLKTALGDVLSDAA
ncbi:MAG: sulfotransferase [Pseudomonadota bacterium]